MQPRARAAIDLQALRRNLRTLSAHAGVPVLLPVKANGYGHGAALVARAAQDEPAVWGFGVATPAEALELAQAGVSKPVLVMTPTTLEEQLGLAGHGVRVTLTSAEEVRALPPGVLAHLKVNTGMNRLGVRPQEAPALAWSLHERGQLEGLMTHFANSEGPDMSSADAQLARFREVLRSAPPVPAHASNSGGVFSYGRDAAFDMVRPGIAAYGYAPDPHLHGRLPLSPVMRVEARVGFVHRVPAGEAVSYGGLWRAPRDTDVAVLGIGYADGYPRPATGQAQARLHGELRPVLGRICMDQCMVDVTGLDVTPGEWVEVLGPGALNADVVGAWAGTISYEILTGIGQRVLRTPAGISAPGTGGDARPRAQHDG